MTENARKFIVALGSRGQFAQDVNMAASDTETVDLIRVNESHSELNTGRRKRSQETVKNRL